MNEIELLERFRDDVPDPSTDAWLRARAAVAAAKQQGAVDDRSFDAIRSLRSRQGRAARRLAVFGVGALTAATALTLALTGMLGITTPHGNPVAQTSPTTNSIQTAGFVLTANANGTVTLTMNQVLDPAALQQALQGHGIPVLVKTDTDCTSNPAAPDPTSIGVLTTQPPFPSGAAGLVPAPAGSPGTLPSSAHIQTVINPAAIPAGTELFFDYAPGDNLVAVGLINPHSYTCTAGTQFRPQPKS